MPLALFSMDASMLGSIYYVWDNLIHVKDSKAAEELLEMVYERAEEI